jgi:hypothetical protein
MPAARQMAAFHDQWCRLEARLKAHGTGLTGPEEGLGQDPPAQLRDLLLPVGYSGCLALL